MDQGHNQYQNQQYNYDHYDQAPQAGAQKRGLTEKIFGPKIAGQLKSPLAATCILLLVGIAFAAIIMASYPDSSEEEAVAVPIVQADARPFKTAPDEPGGMEIPFRDSTVFDTVRNDGEEGAPIENLLANDTAEEAVDKLAAFEEQVEDAVKEDAEAATEGATEAGDAAQGTTKMVKQEVEKISPQDLAKPTKTAAAERPELHTPGASPDTIAFVRSVLDKKDGEAAAAPEAAVANAAASQQAAKVPTAQELASIEPAAGAAGGAVSSVAAPGDYFVQLASVQSQGATKAEWTKLQKKFSSDLNGLDYTVQEANLGERGTYYRIRVGPYSKEYASQLCGSIKAQKPGACLVTK